MPVTSVVADETALTLTAIGDYPVSVERLWQAWADPRQLERFWGPPQWPATFTRHDLTPGGRSEYHMNGNNGECSRGFWEFESVEPGVSFSLRDGFRNEDGSENTELPGTQMRIEFTATKTGSRFVAVSQFATLEALEQLVAMGMVEGLTSALGQLDAVIAELREHARTFTTNLEVIDDITVSITREVAGNMALIWRAYHEAALVQRWMLGPDGWTMPVCKVAAAVGEKYRYEWENSAGDRFGFVGQVLEFEPPRRSVTTEIMIGMDGPGTTNELVLTPRPGDRTLITQRITYPSKELRDIVLGTGMVDGMEASYARLESISLG